MLSRFCKLNFWPDYAAGRPRLLFISLFLLISLLSFPGSMLEARGDKHSAKPGELPPASSIIIERFAAEHGYITGVDNVVLLCVVRNVGTAALTDNTLRLRCYPVAGLDYTVGNLLPILPPLAPGQAVVYRWRLAPIDAHTALVAGVVLENQGAASPPASPPVFSPQLAFTVVSRLAHTPTLGEVPQFKDPLSHAGERDSSGLILNNHVCARILIGERREPLLVLGAKEGAVWRTIASSLPLLRACLGEDGQSPWLQTFHCRQMRAREDKNSATLTLSGTFGLACRADLTLESRPDTGVIVAHLRLTALRSLRLAAVQLPALTTALDTRALPPTRSDGSPLLLTETPSPLPEEMRLAAAHSGATTFGVAWPADLPLAGWKWRRQPSADGGYTLNLGVQAAGDPRGDLIQAGASVELSFRLFAFAPSDTIRDATRFQLP